MAACLFVLIPQVLAKKREKNGLGRKKERKKEKGTSVLKY